MYNYRTMEMWNLLYYKHKYIYKYVHKFMHMYMNHEYESVYEYGSNAFELLFLWMLPGHERPQILLVGH